MEKYVANLMRFPIHHKCRRENFKHEILSPYFEQFKTLFIIDTYLQSNTATTFR